MLLHQGPSLLAHAMARRQAHHYGNWTAPYVPTGSSATLFDDVFADTFPGKRLSEVVALGGGGVNALGRHSVAALLNAASVASVMLTTEAVITEIPEEKPAPPMPDAGGMGGMY